MKIANRFVVIEVEGQEPGVMTISFPLSKARLTLTLEEARQLWASLSYFYGE